MVNSHISDTGVQIFGKETCIASRNVKKIVEKPKSDIVNYWLTIFFNSPSSTYLVMLDLFLFCFVLFVCLFVCIFSQIFDRRHVRTARGMFEAICEHLAFATNGGNIR